MKMKPHTDWTDAMRQALRDAEIQPAEGGWERLQRELEAAEKTAAPVSVTPRRSLWRIYGPRIAAAAAVVLLGIVAGELLWQPELQPDVAAPGLASMSAADDAAVGRPETSDEESGRLRSMAESSTLLARADRVSAGKAERASVRTPAAETPSERGRGTTYESASKSAAPHTATAPSGEDGRASAADEAVADADKSAEETRQRRSATRSAPSSNAAGRKSASVRSVAAANGMEDPFAEANHRSSGTSLSLFAGGGMTGGGTLGNTALRSYSIMAGDAVSIVGNGNNFAPMQRNDYNDYEESSFRHHLPLSFGLTLRKELPRGFSLESGVVYTLLRSDVRTRFSSKDVSQKLHFIGIPLRMNWQFVARGGLSAYLGAGGMAEKCVSAKFGSETVDESSLQWSLLAAVGAQYRLTDYVGLYFEPEVSYYLTDTELRTSRSDAPLTLTLRLGVRVLF